MERKEHALFTLPMEHKKHSPLTLLVERKEHDPSHYHEEEYVPYTLLTEL